MREEGGREGGRDGWMDGGGGRDLITLVADSAYIQPLTFPYSRLSVLTKYHKLYAVQVSTMKDLLHSIKESKTLLPKSLTPEDLKKKANDSDKSNDWVG